MADNKQAAESIASYQHIRNATGIIIYAGKTFLVDPMLAVKDAYPGFRESIDRPDMRMPICELPMPAEDVIKRIDAVILTHTHLDHWDEAAQKIIPKDTVFFVQNAGDARDIRGLGFSDVRVVGKNTPFGAARISRVVGWHGTDEMYSIPALAELLGDAMGFVLQADGMPTVFFMGDNNWNNNIDYALSEYKPEAIIMNAGYARLKINGHIFDGSLIMGLEDVRRASQAAPEAKIIAVHMDTVNHTMVSREILRDFLTENHLEKGIYIPDDGETISLK